ncbi:hypothetical protein BC938DRAFT_480938 [Jimgerdemannia flammicorona]|uniref:Uncharacterized protein n=1 Tax=Jimgerdemannia flammicorona TaxID=994334 RepID=A0A433QHH2_9FUNG|nr:hypothetical protein BC938DRAFT_480938 [Jimgerdemannia flammicorona]
MPSSPHAFTPVRLHTHTPAPSHLRILAPAPLHLHAHTPAPSHLRTHALAPLHLHTHMHVPLYSRMPAPRMSACPQASFLPACPHDRIPHARTPVRLHVRPRAKCLHAACPHSHIHIACLSTHTSRPRAIGIPPIHHI